MTPLHGPTRTRSSSPLVHVDRLPGSSTAARKAASRAAQDGLLLPVRRGLYYRWRRTRYGVVAPRPDKVARAVLGTRGIGPAGYSAARAWGVTTQVPPRWHVATLRTVDPIGSTTSPMRSVRTSSTGRSRSSSSLGAVAMRLLEIGEAVKGLSPDLTSTEPDVAWNGAALDKRLPIFGQAVTRHAKQAVRRDT